MTIGLLPDEMKPAIHRVRTRWIRGFITFLLAPCARTVRLTVPVCPESGFLDGTCRRRPTSARQRAADQRGRVLG